VVDRGGIRHAAILGDGTARAWADGEDSRSTTETRYHGGIADNTKVGCRWWFGRQI
jgi:hypothetical protein